MAEAERTLRSYLQLQEQLHSALLAIEQARRENSVAARTNADALAARLAMIEESLDRQRDQQSESLRSSNRTLLVLGGTLIGVGFVSLVVMVFFQLRGMNRLAEMASGMPLAPGLPVAGALGAGDPRLLGPAGSGPETARLHGVIERLERRIQELEGATRPTKLAAAAIDIPAASSERTTVDSPSGRGTGQATVLLGKGQALLSLGQHEGALRCFDEALAAAPGHAEAHVRRGQALERLKRFDEALASYDQALALDPSVTQAYLGKGSVFNQQERYGEALDCYEQALRSESAAS
jgi:tetratricopeptide (TPR) repeat protein